MKAQNDKILNYLEGGRTITPMSALNMFGCFRLSARIHNLRAKGYPIKTKAETKDGKTYARYYL